MPNQSPNSSRSFSFAILLLVVGSSVLFYLYFRDMLTLDYVRSHQDALSSYYREHPLIAIVLFLASYFIVAALSIPGSVLFTLCAGGLFGFWLGTLLSLIASTLGAVCAFLLSRYLLGNRIQKRFQEPLKTINKELTANGAWYILSLRLIPTFPFFIVNIVLGLTPVGLRSFSILSFFGMIPGTMAYANAGREMSQITSLSGILSFRVLLAFGLLGLVPLVGRGVVTLIEKRRNP